MRMWPQFTYVALMLIGLGIAMARLGQQKKDSYDIFDVLIGPLIMVTLLYYGGFFAPFGWTP